MNKKKITAFALALFVIMSLCSISAAPLPAAQSLAYYDGGKVTLLRWANVGSCNATLTISGTTATCKGNVNALSGTTIIDATITLYEDSGYGWEYLTSWSQSNSSASLNMTKYSSVTRGCKYQLILDADVYRNGTWESVSVSSNIINFK